MSASRDGHAAEIQESSATERGRAIISCLYYGCCTTPFRGAACKPLLLFLQSVLHVSCIALTAIAATCIFFLPPFTCQSAVSECNGPTQAAKPSLTRPETLTTGSPPTGQVRNVSPSPVPEPMQPMGAPCLRSPAFQEGGGSVGEVGEVGACVGGWVGRTGNGRKNKR